MKLNFKNTLIATSIAAGLFGASAFAVAQSGNGQGQGQGPNAEMQTKHMGERGQAKGDTQGKHRMDRMAKMQARHAEHQAQLKAALKLKPEQEAAWSAFVARTAHEPRMAGKDGMQREDMSKLTTPERLDKMQARHAERSEQMAKRIDATKSFYASLSSEQQKTFDSQTMRGFQRTGMKGGERRGQHGGGHEGHRMGGEGHMKGQMPMEKMQGK